MHPGKARHSPGNGGKKKRRKHRTKEPINKDLRNGRHVLTHPEGAGAHVHPVRQRPLPPRPAGPILCHFSAGKFTVRLRRVHAECQCAYSHAQLPFSLFWHTGRVQRFELPQEQVQPHSCIQRCILDIERFLHRICSLRGIVWRVAAHALHQECAVMHRDLCEGPDRWGCVLSAVTRPTEASIRTPSLALEVRASAHSPHSL